MLTTSLYFCKLFPIFTSLHSLLKITVVLRTAQISTFSKITRRWRRWWACWSASVCLTFAPIRSCNVFVCPLCRSPSRAMCLFIKQIGYNIFMSSMSTTDPKEISSDSNSDVSMDQHSTQCSTCAVKKRWLGGNHSQLKGLETWDGSLISFNTHCFCFYTK